MLSRFLALKYSKIIEPHITVLYLIERSTLMITTEGIPALAASVNPSVRLHVNSPHTFYGEPTTQPMAIGMRTEMAAAEFEERFYYINHMHLPITIQRRDGLPITVASNRSHTSSDFIIRRVLTLKNTALNSAQYALTASQLDNSELEELRRCFKTMENGAYREAAVMMDYVITWKDLQAKGGSVYHYQLDLAISSKEAANMPPHPYSSRFLNIGGFGDVKQYAEQRELNLKIRYVDHSPVASKKYLNIAGKVYCLTPQRDAPFSRISARVNGKRTERIYPDYLDIFYSANADPHVVDNTGVGHTRVALAEAKETVGLYDTYEEAYNTEANRKEKLAKLVYEVDYLKAQVAREKAALDQEELRIRADLTREKRELEQLQAKVSREQFEMDTERKALDAQRKVHDEQLDKERREHTEKLAALRDEREARYRAEQLIWKDLYEKRSMERKDNSDLVKLIPTILLSTLTVAAAWMKISSQAKSS